MISQPAKPLISSFQDLNHPPEMIEKSLELKLESSCTSSEYQSVCTLEKVKNALQRDAEKKKKKRSSSTGTGMMFAAGCPVCLLYVITLKTNPICPRCNSTVVSSSLLRKKPKLDLNASTV